MRNTNPLFLAAAFAVAATLVTAALPGAEAATLAQRLSGYILLQVEAHGEAWYVDPYSDERYYMGRPSDAFDLMREFGLGIIHEDLALYLENGFPAWLSGQIMLDVERNGEAFYVYPDSLEGHYLGRPADAFLVMRQLGLGISNENLDQIPVGPGSAVPTSEGDISLERTMSPVVDTYQSHCYDDGAAIECPAEGEDFFGQDAQYAGNAPSYIDNGDGTVTDSVTGLMWQQGHNAERLTFEDAELTCDWLIHAGHTDWRLPNIKELYSLSDWRGVTGTADFVDNDHFDLEWPDESILEGDPFAETHSVEMMGQTWSDTHYTGDLWGRGKPATFFFNFLDGRIKAANTETGELFYRCVRGPEYGANDLSDLGDGTVEDRATGLIWQQADDGQARTWSESLAYCEDLELGGDDDWRLPNVKELQSIVNYEAHDPATYPEFVQTNPAAWFWSSTTFETGREATYVCFGKCIAEDGTDVHGAGAQRSDPKSGDPAEFTGRGGQNDEVRIMNYARCVRGGAELTEETSPPETAPAAPEPEEPPPAEPPGPPAEAIAACEGMVLYAGCNFVSPLGDTITGTCAADPTFGLFCRP